MLGGAGVWCQMVGWNWWEGVWLLAGVDVGGLLWSVGSGWTNLSFSGEVTRFMGMAEENGVLAGVEEGVWEKCYVRQ